MKFSFLLVWSTFLVIDPCLIPQLNLYTPVPPNSPKLFNPHVSTNVPIFLQRVWILFCISKSKWEPKRHSKFFRFIKFLRFIKFSISLNSLFHWVRTPHVHRKISRFTSSLWAWNANDGSRRNCQFRNSSEFNGCHNVNCQKEDPVYPTILRTLFWTCCSR